MAEFARRALSDDVYSVRGKQSHHHKAASSQKNAPRSVIVELEDFKIGNNYENIGIYRNESRWLYRQRKWKP